MAGQENLVQESVDRFNEAVDSIGDEVEKVQKRLKTRRSRFEKELRKSRRDFEKETRKRFKRIQTEIDKNPTTKRVRRVVADAQKQIESRVELVLGTFQIASKTDVQRIDKKLNQINRKLKELEKSRKGNGSAAASL